jgi:4-hydroxy-2-oxoheptanedioate aldolase
VKKNRIKEKLSRGEYVLGVQTKEPSTGITEVLGLLGFDYLNIDCQHSPISEETVAQIVMAAEIRGITPMVRVAQFQPEIILRYLDAGVMGIIVGDMDTPEMAQKAVAAVKYPPLGERGLSSVRAADYGLTEPMSSYVKAANAETMVLGIIESREGIENAEAILATEGLDGVSVGATDLSKALGVPGQRNHPVVQEAIDKVLAAARKAGKPVGSIVRQGELPKQYVDRGFRMVYTSLITLIADSARAFLAKG